MKIHETFEIKTDRYFISVAENCLVKNMGFAPKDNEALFMEMRTKKRIKPAAEVVIDEEAGTAVFRCTLGDIRFDEKNTVMEGLFINEWAKACLGAVVNEIRIRISEVIEGRLAVSEAVTTLDGALSESRLQELAGMSEFVGSGITINEDGGFKPWMSCAGEFNLQ